MIRIIFDFAASASLKINPFGSCILVSCSSPVTGKDLDEDDDENKVEKDEGSPIVS